jgi:hypothetical protein
MAALARKPQSPTERLAAAQAELEQANARLAELAEQRNAALLKDDNAGAIAFGVEISNLKLAARAHEDKIKLLREQAVEEERARREREREAQIGKIEEKIEQRDQAMQEVAAAIKQLAAASERAIKLGREVVPVWSWQPHDLPAALLTPPSVLTAISHEMFRVSYHARRYGGMDTDPLAGHMLPGSRCPRLEWLEQPERTRPMSDVVRDASSFAKQFLHTGKSSSAVEVVAAPLPVMNGGERSEAEQRLASLLKKQAELEADLSLQGEREYQRVVAAIAAVQTEIDAARKMEQQHG